MANGLLVLMPQEQRHGAFSILKQIGILSPDGTKATAVKNVMKLIANSLSVAKVAPDRLVNLPISDSTSVIVLVYIFCFRWAPVPGCTRYMCSVCQWSTFVCMHSDAALRHGTWNHRFLSMSLLDAPDNINGASCSCCSTTDAKMGTIANP